MLIAALKRLPQVPQTVVLPSSESEQARVPSSSDVDQFDWGGGQYEIFRLNNVDIQALLYQYVDPSETGSFDDGDGDSESGSEILATGDALHGTSLSNLEGSSSGSNTSSPLSSCPPSPFFSPSAQGECAFLSIFVRLISTEKPFLPHLFRHGCMLCQIFQSPFRHY